MKSIIVISTLLFVTASFVGIGNYIKYNNTLKEKGLYATPAAASTVANQEVQESAAPRVEEILDEQNENNKEEVVVQQNKTIKKHQAKKSHNPAVLHAAKKPREREINFKEFSRAPLDDYELPPAKPTETEAVESVEPSKEEEKE